MGLKKSIQREKIGFENYNLLFSKKDFSYRGFKVSFAEIKRDKLCKRVKNDQIGTVFASYLLWRYYVNTIKH